MMSTSLTLLVYVIGKYHGMAPILLIWSVVVVAVGMIAVVVAQAASM